MLFSERSEVGERKECAEITRGKRDEERDTLSGGRSSMKVALLFDYCLTACTKEQPGFEEH
jgi:hypothetical protein